MAFLSGVILAAGRSTRLGRPKQLLDLGGEPLLRHVVRSAVASELSEVILVLGHQAGRISAAVGAQGQRTVVNPDHAAGQSTSVRVGLDEVDPRADAVLFLLGDQPQVDSRTINAVIRGFIETGGPIVMPTYGGEPGHPVLFARELFPELIAVTGDQGARTVIARHADRVVHLPVSDAPPPRDIDTQEDYQRLLDDLSARETKPPPSGGG